MKVVPVDTRRPTILQIIPRLDTGGAELSTIEITEAVVRAGGRAIVLSEGGRMSGRIAAAGGTLVAFPAASKSPLVMAQNARRIAALVRAEGVGLIHARSRAPAWSAFAAARRTGTPFVTTYHGAYGETNPLKRLYNSVMARSDVVIANSQFTAELVMRRYGTRPDRIAVVHRGVDIGRFDPACVDPSRVAALRRQWGVADHQRIAIHVARLTGWKGQSVVIDAAERLRAAGALADTVLVLAGDAQGRDDYALNLRRQADATGLADAVRFPGHVDDVPAAFLAAHVAIVASTEPEAFGRAATEAQAMGCPVIATRIGAPPETVLAEPACSAETATGWLVPPGDATALAAALAKALAQSDGAQMRMGARGRAHVLRNFTLADMQRGTLAVYDRLLGTELAVRLGTPVRAQ